MSRKLAQAVLDFLQAEVEAEHIPGAVVLVSAHGEVILHEAVGYRSIHPARQPMSADTVFDLASLTKVVATLPSVLKLLETGRLALDDPAAEFLPGWKESDRHSITIRHLLTHTSGLPADVRRDDGMTREQLLDKIDREPLRYTPGEKVVYSDLGMIYLAQIVEIAAQEPFDRFVRRTVFEPLEMHDTDFNPKKPPSAYASTEYSAERGGYKCGVVHDEKADILGGVSGHAGLFSTAADLHNYATMIENGGTFKNRKIFARGTIELARRNFTPGALEWRGLGWLLKNPQGYSPCGDLFPESSYGHTGFTGTSIWFDPQIRLHVILLTNRVHLGRHGHILRLRPRLHNVIRSHFPFPSLPKER